MTIQITKHTTIYHMIAGTLTFTGKTMEFPEGRKYGFKNARSPMYWFTAKEVEAELVKLG